MARLERQRRAARLRTWMNKTTGMWHLSGAFDPESGVVLHGRLEAAMAAMFAARTPSTTPSDPGEKQDHLRALALLAITNGSASRPSKPVANGTDQSGEWDAFAMALSGTGKRFGRPEVSVVIDTTNLGPDGKPTVDWGIPVTIPWSRIQDLCRTAIVRPVIVREGAVIDADGELNLGRSTRLANRAQRRALRASYATCAVDGCSVFVQPHETASRALVAKRRTHRHRQSPALVQQAPSPRSRRRLAIHARTEPRVDDHAPGCSGHEDWTAEPTGGGMTPDIAWRNASFGPRGPGRVFS